MAYLGDRINLAITRWPELSKVFTVYESSAYLKIARLSIATLSYDFSHPWNFLNSHSISFTFVKIIFNDYFYETFKQISLFTRDFFACHSHPWLIIDARTYRFVR